MNLFQSYTSLVKSSGAGDKVFSLLDRRPAAPGTGSTEVLCSEVGGPQSNPQSDNRNRNQSEGRGARGGSNSASYDGRSCSVEITDVEFAYPSRPNNSVLKKLSLNIPQGKIVALVGASGESSVR